MPFPKPKTRMQFTLAIVLGLIAVIGFIQLILWAGLSFTSIKGEDLTIFLESDNEQISLDHAQNATIGFTLGINTLPFCQVRCSWEMENTATNTVIANGSDNLQSKVKVQRQVTVQAPLTGESTVAYQFRTVCTTAASTYCKSDREQATAATVTLVDVSYSDEEQQAYDRLSQELPQWENNTRKTMSLLAGIIALNDPRTASVRAQASSELQSNQERVTKLIAAVQRDDMLSANSLLVNASSQAVDTYAQLVQLEKEVVNKHLALASSQTLLNQLLLVSSAQDAAVLSNSSRNFNLHYLDFAHQPLQNTAAGFDEFNATLSALSNQYVPLTINRSQVAAQLLYAEKLMMCTIKTAPCPAQPMPVITFDQAITQLQMVCSQLQNLSSELAQATYETNATVDVNATRAEPGFALYEQEIMDAARNGVLITNNESIREAVTLTPSNQTSQFTTSCSFTARRVSLVQQPLTATLPQQPTAPVTLPPIVLPAKNCCSLGVCNACVPSQKYPVVFVHGHSFIESTSPEDNLNAFTNFAFALQDDGYLYAGHVFPRQDLDKIPFAQMRSLPSGVSFTATYYYDSYPQEGTNSLIITKSKDIETYALRLREALTVVKYKTGSEKVILVSHSMGGLVSRKYMQIFGGDDVAALIMIGTPNGGISDNVQRLCPVFGASMECSDMATGSVFLAKLNNAKTSVPMYTIAGRGCNGEFDGIVTVNSVLMPNVPNTIVDGSCTNGRLHSALLNPVLYPVVYERVHNIIEEQNSGTIMPKP